MQLTLMHTPLIWVSCLATQFTSSCLYYSTGTILELVQIVEGCLNEGAVAANRRKFVLNNYHVDIVCEQIGITCSKKPFIYIFYKNTKFHLPFLGVGKGLVHVIWHTSQNSYSPIIRI